MSLGRREALKGLLTGAGAALAAHGAAGGALAQVGRESASIEIRFSDLVALAYDSTATLPALGKAGVLLPDTTVTHHGVNLQPLFGTHMPKLILHISDVVSTSLPMTPDPNGFVTFPLTKVNAKRQQVVIYFDDAPSVAPLNCVSKIKRPAGSWKVDRSPLELDYRDIIWVPQVQDIIRSRTPTTTAYPADRNFIYAANPEPFLGARVFLNNGTIEGDRPENPLSKHVRHKFTKDAAFEQPLIDAIRYRSVPAGSLQIVIQDLDGGNSKGIIVWPATGDTVRAEIRNTMSATGTNPHFEVHHYFGTQLSGVLPVPTDPQVIGTACSLTGCNYPIFCPPARTAY